jgi:hypothetical protein
MSKAFIFPFFLIFVAGILIGYSLTTLVQYRVANVSAIKSLGLSVFWDQNKVNPVTTIDWGILDPDSSKTFIVYVESTSNVPLTAFVYAEKWQPLNAADFISFEASPNNFILEPGQVVQVALTLKVAYDIQGITAFSFDIMFNGSE